MIAVFTGVDMADLPALQPMMPGLINDRMNQPLPAVLAAADAMSPGPAAASPATRTESAQ